MTSDQRVLTIIRGAKPYHLKRFLIRLNTTSGSQDIIA